MKSKRPQKKNQKGGSDRPATMVALGNLHLKFTLTLNDDWLRVNKKKFDHINSLEDLSFLKNDKYLWDEVLVSSNNKSMNMLLQANKSTKKKVFIEYVVMDHINFSKEQEALKEFVNCVTEKNFIFMKESQACPCNADIILYLINGSNTKSFNLSQCKNLVTKAEINEKEKEEQKKAKKKQQEEDELKKQNDEDAELLQGNEPEKNEPEKNEPEKNDSEKNDPEKNDPEKNEPVEVSPAENEENPNPPEAQAPPEEDNSDSNPFTKITEVDFNKYEYLFFDLTDFTLSELGTSIKLTDIMKFIQHLKVNTKLQLIFYFPNLVSKSLTDEEMSAIDQLLLLTDVYLFERKEAYHTFNVLHLYTSEEKNPKDLDKKQDIPFFINEVCYQCPIQYKQKIGVFMEDFTKVTLVQVSQNSKASVNELDALIYPKINHHNMKIVDEYKSCVNSNYDEYLAIFFGALIGKLIQGEFSEKEVYVSYLIGIESAKKVLELKKNGIELPRQREFYIVKLPAAKVDQNLQTQMLKQKENKFVLDCVNEQQSKLKYYNPLFDFHLNTYFSSNVNRKELKSKGFINSKGYIMYDAVYREMMGSSPKRKRNEDIDEGSLLNTIQDIKVGERVKNKELNTKEVTRKRNSPLSRKLPGYAAESNRKNLYGTRSKQLPPINKTTCGNEKQSNTNRMSQSKQQESKTQENVPTNQPEDTTANQPEDTTDNKPEETNDNQQEKIEAEIPEEEAK